MGCTCFSIPSKETKNEKKQGGSSVNEVIFIREKNFPIEQNDFSELNKYAHKPLYQEKETQQENTNILCPPKKLQEIGDIKNIFKNEESKLQIKPKQKEEMLPIWCNKGKEIKISARGFYRLLTVNQEVPPSGILDRVMPNGFPLGALLFRIKGDSNYHSFNINKELLIRPNFSGPLFVSFNIFNIQVEHEQQISIHIENAERMSIEDIYKKLNINLQPMNLNGYSDIEKEHFQLLNHLRSDIKAFKELYLLNKNLDSDLKQLIENNINLSQFIPDDDLKKISDKLANELGSTGRFSHEDLEGQGATERLRDLNGKQIIVRENILISSDPSGNNILCKMLLDDLSGEKENRNNILNPKLNRIGISIREHKKFKWIAVYNFSE
jgi:hypothetical protein